MEHSGTVVLSLPKSQKRKHPKDTSQRLGLYFKKFFTRSWDKCEQSESRWTHPLQTMCEVGVNIGCSMSALKACLTVNNYRCWPFLVISRKLTGRRESMAPFVFEEQLGNGREIPFRVRICILIANEPASQPSEKLRVDSKRQPMVC